MSPVLIGAAIFLIVAVPVAYWTTGKAASLLNAKAGLKVAALLSLACWIALDAVVTNVNAALNAASDGSALFRGEEISIFACAHVFAYFWSTARATKSAGAR